jgi:hypothetical protein
MIDLKEQYGKKYKTIQCDCQGEHLGDLKQWKEIRGKYGYIRLWGDDLLELYLSRRVIENRIERQYPAFKPKNRYDDATAFVFENKPELVASACKWIRAKNRKQLNPEQLQKLRARLATIRSLRNKP